jgi:hypothetical protein
VTGGPAQLPWAQSAALRTFGRPERTCSCHGCTITVWDAGLLTASATPG